MLKPIAATAILTLLAGAPAWAESSQNRSHDQQQQSQATERQSKVPLDQLSLAESDMLSKSTVRDSAGNKVGKIESLVVDIKRGQVAYAIISANGKDIAVPWQRLQPANQPETFTLNANATALDGAPTVDRKNLAQLREPQERQRITAFWESVPTSQQAQVPGESKQQQQQQQQPQ